MENLDIISLDLLRNLLRGPMAVLGLALEPAHNCYARGLFKFYQAKNNSILEFL